MSVPFPEFKEEPPTEADEAEEEEKAEDIEERKTDVQVVQRLSEQAAETLQSVEAEYAPSPAMLLASTDAIAPAGEQVQPPLPPPRVPPPPPPRHLPPPVPDPGPNGDPVERLNAGIDRLRLAVRESGNWDPQQLQYARLGFGTSVIAILVGVATTLGPLTYEWIHNAVRGTTDPWSGLLSESQIQVLTAVVNAWGQLTDAQLWEHCAEFSDAHDPQPGTQILICQDIVNFSPAVAWAWSPAEKAAAVNALVAAYEADSYKGSAVYRTVETYETADGTLLPRGVAANCCALAFAIPLTTF